MSYLSELDSSGFDQRNTEDLLSERAPVEQKPGFFAGIVKGPAAGFMRGLTNLNDLALTATDLVYPMSDEERDTQAGIRRKLTDYFTPDAHTVGTAGRVLGRVTEGLAPLVVPGAGPALMVGSNTLAAGKRLVDEGVDSTTAGSAAAIEGAASYAGLKLPILGGTLGHRLLTGAAGNLALGAGSTEANRALLDARGYQELAQNYDPLDAEARAVDLLSGLVFGGLHHLTLPSERDAVATLTNAKHFQKDTAPGIPADAQASAAHQRAMETATEQTLRGEPVNVDPEVTQADFVPRENPGNPVPEDLKALDAAQQELIDKSAAPDQSGGYNVSEGELTDEQLAAFQGLRSDVPGDQNLRAAGEGVPGQSGNPNDGGARGEPLTVFRGSARELGAQDFQEGALGHATGHPSSGLGVFFTNERSRAAQYGKVSEHLLDVRNPKVIPVDKLPGFDSLEEAAAFRKKLQAEGHDGIVIDASHLGGTVDYVAFKHEQVLKSQAPKAKVAPKAQEKPKAAQPGAAKPESATADDPTTAAVRESLAAQDVKLPTGEVDANGNHIVRSAREALAEVDAEVAEAEKTGQGIAAAVSCFLTRGT